MKVQRLSCFFQFGTILKAHPSSKACSLDQLRPLLQFCCSSTFSFAPSFPLSITFASIAKCCSVVRVVSDVLRPHGLHHAKFPCPSLSSRVCSNSCLLSQWCHATISSCQPILLLPLLFPSIRVFSNESVLCIRWPKYWSFSFSISPSKEYSGLITFKMDWCL